jgi:hypothetical protein
MRTWIIVLCVVWVLPSCRRPAATPPAAPAPRYGPECADAVARARAEPGLPAIRPPVPTRLFLPPMPAPASARGQVIAYEVPVDSAGRADTAAAVLKGVADAAYAARVRRTMQAAQFRPAVLDGCGVPGTARVTFQLQ